MTRVRYTGVHAGTLMDYTDLETGRAVEAVPGGVYDVAPASGRAVPDMPAHCVAVDEAPAKKAAPGKAAVGSDEDKPGEPAE